MRYLSGRPKGVGTAELVNASPGVGISKLTYHSRVLEQHGLVATVAIGGASAVGYASAVTGNAAVVALLEITEGRDSSFKPEP